jgi:hypothetical protein
MSIPKKCIISPPNIILKVETNLWLASSLVLSFGGGGEKKEDKVREI